jgi:ribosomal protein L11 methyltransferase
MMPVQGRIFRALPIEPFVIIPEGETATTGIPIILGRKGAFGSGEHETTVACLEELSKFPSISGSTVLDLGSGTGILAIAAVRLGASHVVALDNDPHATISCIENVRLNDLEGQVETICGELASITSKSFDLILANSYADLLLILAADMVSIILIKKNDYSYPIWLYDISRADIDYSKKKATELMKSHT